MTAWEFRTPGTGLCHYVARLINLFAQLMPSLWVPVPPCGGSRGGKSSPLLGSPVTPWSICSTPFSSEIRLRPHRGVLRISASVKPHRFSWSQSSEAWTPTMTSCKHLTMKVLIFFLVIKISDMLFLKACVSNQHNQPLIWLIWVPLVPTVSHRHTAPVLGKSSKLSVASAALTIFQNQTPQRRLHCLLCWKWYFKSTHTNKSTWHKTMKTQRHFHFIVNELQTSTTYSPYQEGLSALWFFYPSSSTFTTVQALCLQERLLTQKWKFMLFLHSINKPWDNTAKMHTLEISNEKLHNTETGNFAAE